MPRTLAAAFQTETLADTFMPVFFADMAWSDGAVRFWTGIGDITFSALTFNGTGTMGVISEVRETSDLYASGFVLSISGVPSDIVSKVYTSKHRGRAVTIYMGALNMTTWALVATPDILRDGFMESVSDVDGGQTARISVFCEDEAYRANQLRERRYTDHDQLDMHGGDTGLSHRAKAEDRAVDWGTKGY